MLSEKIEVLFFITAISNVFTPASCAKRTVVTLHPDYTYPESYKDMTYTALSEKGREMFFAIKTRK